MSQLEADGLCIFWVDEYYHSLTEDNWILLSRLGLFTWHSHKFPPIWWGKIKRHSYALHTFSRVSLANNIWLINIHIYFLVNCVFFTSLKKGRNVCPMVSSPCILHAIWTAQLLVWSLKTVIIGQNNIHSFTHTV